MAEVAPELLLVEVGEGEEEVGHRALLLAQEREELVRELACVHARMVSCVFEAAPYAPGGRWRREDERGVVERLWPLARRKSGSRGREKGLHARRVTRK